MKIKFVAGIAGVLLLFGVTGVSWAALEIIGTAEYGPNEYNLIWQDDNDGQSLVWLDYSHTRSTWDNQNYWADLILGEVLILNINQGYTVDWGTNSWRLPTTSEMRYLFYEEIYDRVFENFVLSRYWSGTELDHTYASFFNMNGAYPDNSNKRNNYYGLAVRSGQVSAVPVPGAVWLLGSGLVGLAGLHRRRTESRVSSGPFQGSLKKPNYFIDLDLLLLKFDSVPHVD